MHGFCRVGDPVRTVERLEGFWSSGERGSVIGLGIGSAPIAIHLHRVDRVFNVQTSRIEVLNSTEDEHGSWWTKLASISGLSTGIAPRQTQVVTSPDHYTILRLRADFSEDELRRAYRNASLTMHPDKGGSAEAFAAASDAYRVLSDTHARLLYDNGGDLPGRTDSVSLQKEVEQRYFPERTGWQAFGDPHERRRLMQERRQREHEDAKIREQMKRAGDAGGEL